MEFKLEIYDLNPVTGAYTRKDSISNFGRLQFLSVKNSSGAARWTLGGMSPKASSSNLLRLRTLIAIKYNSQIIWSGFVARPRPTYENINYTWNLECLEYFARLKGRFTELNDNYAQQGQGNIAWNLINNTQLRTNGHLGIAQGVTDNSQLRDRTYSAYNVAEAIENLSGVIDGFDFDLTPVVDGNGIMTSHLFNTYQSLGTTRYDLPALKLGSTVISFQGFTNEEIVNHALYKGAGTGSDPIYQTAEDTASQLNYSRNEEVYLREDISDANTLLSWAQRTILDLKDNQYLFELVLKPNSNLDLFSFRIGDTLRLNLSGPEMTKQFVGDCEVIAKEFMVDPQGVLGANIKVIFTE